MSKFNEQQLADLYGAAVSAEAAGECSTDAGYAFDDVVLELAGNHGAVVRRLIDMLREAQRQLIAPLPIGELLQRLKEQCIGDEYVSLRDLQLSVDHLPACRMADVTGLVSGVRLSDLHKLLRTGVEPSERLATAYSLARKAAQPEVWPDYYRRTMYKSSPDAPQNPDALDAADAAGLIPWRSAAAELPDYPRDGYVPLCIVQIFYCPDPEANPFATEKAIVWDWYKFRHAPRDGQAPGYWENHDGFVLNWCYATDLMKTIPEAE